MLELTLKDTGKKIMVNIKNITFIECDEEGPTLIECVSKTGVEVTESFETIKDIINKAGIF